MKIYSKIDQLPCGKASEKLIQGCLVLEGGAFRGLYSQGFLDAMMLNDLNLSTVIGVSAGALSGMGYVSGQIGRAGRINLMHRHDSRYVGVKAFLHSHSILDVAFLTEDRGIIEPLDKERFYRQEQSFIAVATNCKTGNTVYFEKGKCSDIMAAIRASATMPYISPMVMIDGEPYLDGACSCKIPYAWALERGFDKIIVLRTKEPEYRKEEPGSKAAYRFYRKYPEFADKLSHSNHDYNVQCDMIEKLHKEGRILRIAPSQKVTIGRMEKDLEKLGDLYWLGYNDCIEKIDEMHRFLGI